MNNPFRFTFRSFAVITACLYFLLGFSTVNSVQAADGQALFQACGACHHPEKRMVGPALKGARERWKKNSSEENFYKWIKNSNEVLSSGDAYANQLFKDFNKSPMPAQAVTNEDIDAIFEYVESYTEPVAAVSVNATETAGAQSKEGGWMWIVILGVIFTVIAISAGSVRRQLVNANLEKEGKDELPDLTYWQTWCAWAWRHKVLVSMFALFFIFGGLSDGWYRLKDVGVFENYKPEQPIAFSHKIHAGDNEIACQYCHSTTEKSKHAMIPSPMVCMNCHKAIQKGAITGEEEIAKIYKAVGFDPATMSYTGKTEPIRWVKVHNLPDHVYFSHQQHVVAGQLDCKQCHGEMKNETVARVMPHEELNAIEGNVKVDRATLTMGWCIECHNKAEVKMDGNGYYTELKQRLMNNKALYQKHLADEKITVEELGGWECAKCHY
ncbi:MAG TPA: cytochrome C [Flavobacteriales bacterium]|nr:cytochrome C [Flavobacteriales bacterium]HRE73448.1 cytochrome c3 family protein [Flavobacteriales bacterium]HRE95534.1 cytochrome c3 family protein [Flavobacteriales bacterium]HRJ34351.1 cytochrome c3 family protein [Flavobacteriales bacterium]HRJ38897.1 cytochrome c3 family protein [Flavobacteriales bacterium]